MQRIVPNMVPKEALQEFARLGEMYREIQRPHVERYPGWKSGRWDSLGLFLVGYAFERQGRSGNYAPAAADVIDELKGDNLTPTIALVAWEDFKGRLGGVNLNESNNPMAPQKTSFKKGTKSYTTENVSAVQMVGAIPEPLAVHLLSLMSEGRTNDAHVLLRTVNGVGSKIASFFLRDLAWFAGTFPDENRELLQPVDTWVRRSAQLVTASGGKVSDREIAATIVSMSISAGVVPEQVNMGMWMFGALVAGSDYRFRQGVKSKPAFRELLTAAGSYWHRMADAYDALP